uniref:Oxytetracycline polyketide putative beta-ketoacyl synthase 1 n=1 Tax=Anthurium amnicola TaxID=1678845 RepID=A0A1D1Z6K7_9ARAE
MERGGDAAISRLRGASSSLSAILRASGELEGRLAESGGRISLKLEALADASGAVAPLRAQSMAARALDSRISRAVTPALSLLRSFSLAESLQRRLSRGQGRRGGGLPALLEYVGWVERLEAAVGSVTAGCEPAVQRLQEAVEFC